MVAVATVKRWSVEINIDEHSDERRTWAEARLHTNDATDLRGTGTAHRNPYDREMPEIGDELAVSRALADLAEKLPIASVADVEQLTLEHAGALSSTASAACQVESVR
ncbi:DUF1876 domain-containing protein [Micromonospora globispora]|uniref:DUF1876 domain-containing protein n=1 Tax=Micromonospora globispora TaxID=1450148 RepID=A0A317K7S7_9ACTN|nr:DUF1876 domain-containing protein [Micromonospora globispora]PWU58917.1 DUF1876 domain-containing protein [Micromonospora globispora]RQW88680.1 DUF1876 domain-containing protein [Micromonospora globispora]